MQAEEEGGGRGNRRRRRLEEDAGGRVGSWRMENPHGERPRGEGVSRSAERETHAQWAVVGSRGASWAVLGGLLGPSIREQIGQMPYELSECLTLG